MPAFHGRKELTGNGIDLPMRRESVVAEGKIQDEPQTDEERPFYYKPFRPPYTKPRTSNVVRSSLTASAPTSGIGINEVSEPRKEEPGHHIDRENHLPQGKEPNGGDKVKPVPKSVRSRFLKPQPVQNPDEDEKQSKVVMDQEPKDEKEKKLDSLLVHYSKKKSSSDGSKLPSAIYRTPKQAAAADNLTGRRRMDNRGNAETPRKELAKSASFQAENCHIHPKLPDYEDFVARLAAFRGNLE